MSFSPSPKNDSFHIHCQQKFQAFLDVGFVGFFKQKAEFSL